MTVTTVSKVTKDGKTATKMSRITDIKNIGETKRTYVLVNTGGYVVTIERETLESIKVEFD